MCFISVAGLSDPFVGSAEATPARLKSSKGEYPSFSLQNVLYFCSWGGHKTRQLLPGAVYSVPKTQWASDGHLTGDGGGGGGQVGRQRRPNREQTVGREKGRKMKHPASLVQGSVPSRIDGSTSP